MWGEYMSIQKEITSLLKEAKYDELVSKTLKNKGVIKYLLRLLYHPYGLERWQAVEGLGYISKALVVTETEAVKELIRRLLWSMNDESGTTSWSAPEAIGEIIFRNPEQFQEFVSIVVNASEEEIFHRGVAWALGRIGQVRPDMVKEFIPLLIQFLRHRKPEVRGYAAWALGQMGAQGVQEKLAGLLNDHAEVEVYEEGVLAYKTVRDLSQEAMNKIAIKMSLKK